MTNPYKLFVARRLNLDQTARTYRPPRMRIEIDVDRELPGSQMWLLLRMLFLQCLRDRACAIHFFNDAEDDCFRMLYCFAQQGDTWYEMVPPPKIACLKIIDQLWRRARLSDHRIEGTIRYLFGGEIQTATCVSPNPHDLRVYFSSHRPRSLDKGAGDQPGKPTSNMTDVPDLPSVPSWIFDTWAPEVRKGQPLSILYSPGR